MHVAEVGQGDPVKLLHPRFSTGTGGAIPERPRRLRGICRSRRAEQLVRDIIIPMAGPFTLAVVAFELITGVLVLGRGRWARVGLWAALAWLAGFIPFLGAYALANVVLMPSRVASTFASANWTNG